MPTTYEPWHPPGRSGQELPRPSGPLTRADRRRMLWRAAVGTEGGLRLQLLALCFVVGLGVGALHVHDRGELARELLATGHRSVVTKAAVDVEWTSNKGGGGEFAVAAVEVCADDLPCTELEESRSVYVADGDEGSRPTGYQEPTSDTGYRPPFTVRWTVASDGTVRAFAEEDAVVWASDDDVVYLLAGSLGLLGADAAIVLVRYRRAVEAREERERRLRRAAG